MKTLTLFLLSLLPLMGISQDDSFFVNEEFVFLSEEYSIRGESLSNNAFEFHVIRDSLEHNFKINSINNTEIFKSKLTNSILRTLPLKYSEDQFNRSAKNKLKQILNRIESDSTYKLNKIERLGLEKEFNSASKYLNCQILFESSILDSILTLSHSDDTKEFINERIDSCSNYFIVNDSTYRSTINAIASELFPVILEASKFKRNEASEAGKLIINSKVPVFDWDVDELSMEIIVYKKEESIDSFNNFNIHSSGYEIRDTVFRKIPVSQFQVDSVTIEIYEGQIYNVKAIGTIDGKLEIFENKSPIPFSTKNDINFNGNRWKKHKLESVFYHWKNFLFLADLIEYNYSLLELTENYTPKNQVITIYPNSSGTKVFKEKNKEILEVKIFTDFIGLSDQNPNGLVQTEISRRLPFNTNVLRIGKTSFHASFFNYINPHLDILKIEENNKTLNISTMDSLKFVNFLELDNYRNLGIGLDLNLFNFGMPRYHSLLHLNLKTELSRVELSENMLLINPLDSMSIVNSTSISKSIFKITPELIWHFNPSDKYQLQLSYRNHRVSFFDKNDNIVAVNDIMELTENTEERTNSQTSTIHEFEFLTTLKTNDTSKFFFRTRFNYLREQVNQNYFQVQFGYSYLLLDRKN